MAGQVSIREVLASDAEEVAELSGELGYPVSAAEMHARIQQFAKLPDRVAFVAYLEDHVVGWIDVGVVHHLQSRPYGEIGGLVVSSTQRSRGIGKQLVKRAEEWVTARGLDTILVRSRIAREDAHRFYLQQNFQRWKTSAVFTKQLADPPVPEDGTFHESRFTPPALL
jgi:GNAT superfamily N-acetyltransferase